jgi:hypothetical protein
VASRLPGAGDRGRDESHGTPARIPVELAHKGTGAAGLYPRSSSTVGGRLGIYRTRKPRIRANRSFTLTTCTIYPQNSAVTSPTSGGCLVGVVLSRTQATELVSFNVPGEQSSVGAWDQQICPLL